MRDELTCRLHQTDDRASVVDPGRELAFDLGGNGGD
jgi:hypothetical protein